MRSVRKGDVAASKDRGNHGKGSAKEARRRQVAACATRWAGHLVRSLAARNRRSVLRPSPVRLRDGSRVARVNGRLLALAQQQRREHRGREEQLDAGREPARLAAAAASAPVEDPRAARAEARDEMLRVRHDRRERAERRCIRATAPPGQRRERKEPRSDSRRSHAEGGDAGRDRRRRATPARLRPRRSSSASALRWPRR